MGPRRPPDRPRRFRSRVISWPGPVTADQIDLVFPGSVGEGIDDVTVEIALDPGQHVVDR